MPEVPKLDAYSQRVLTFFSETALPLWTSGFGVAHVPRPELEVEARARGFELTEFFLLKYAVCERAFRDAIERTKSHE